MKVKKLFLNEKIKRLIILILCFVFVFMAIPTSLFVNAVTEDAVGKKGYKFYYKSINFNNIAGVQDKTIFTGENSVNGVKYLYTCSIDKMSDIQSDVVIKKTNKNASSSGAFLEFGEIRVSYFKDGDAVLMQEDFSITDVTISAVFDYQIFRLCFSNDKSNVTKANAFDNTNVLDDLTSAGVDLTNYPFDLKGITKSPSIINFIEFGYSSDSNKQDSFALYVYFYNPQNTKIDYNNLSNRIQLASEYSSYPITANSTPTSYDTYELMFCSRSEGDYSGLFYKFKILDHVGYDGKTIQERVNSAERRYDVSGIVLYDTNGKGVEYTVGGSYRFAGYAKGFGSASESTLENTSFMSLETIRLDVTVTSYRQNNNNQLGEGHYNSISSAYFSIPNKYLTDEKGKTTGNLQKVRLEWWEYKTAPIVFVPDTDAVWGNVYELYKKANGVTIYNYDGIYPHLVWFNAPGVVLPTPREDDKIKSYLTYPLESREPGSILLSGEDLRKDILNYDATANKGYLPIKNGLVSADLFLDTVDSGRTKGYNNTIIDANDKYNLFENNASWIGKLFSIQHLKEFTINEAIYPLATKDLLKADEDFSNSFYVDKNDAGNIKTQATSAKSRNETPYLLRFAINDYIIKTGVAVRYNLLGVLDNMYEAGFVASETVFMDLKFIELTLEVDGEYKTIPVVQDPVDHFPDIAIPDEDKTPPWWTWAILILSIIIGLGILYVELKLTGACLIKGGKFLKVLGIILAIVFIVLDGLYISWVVDLIAGFGGLLL